MKANAVCSVPFYVSTAMKQTRNGCDHMHAYIREVRWNDCVYIELGHSSSQLGHSMPRFTHHSPHQTHNTRTYYPPIVHTFICAKWCSDDQILTVQCCDCSTPLSMYMPTLPLSLPSSLPSCQHRCASSHTQALHVSYNNTVSIP